jgi:AraC family transcriptional regulator
VRETYSDPASIATPGVQILPAEIVRRRGMAWSGIRADAIEVTRRTSSLEYGSCAPEHLLIMSEHAARDDGETLVEGLPKSTQREFSRTLTVVPAGHKFQGWQKPRGLTRVTYFYIDPTAFEAEDFVGIELRPRLFFFDGDLWGTVAKLKALAGRQDHGEKLYGDALGTVLVHELARLNNHCAADHNPRRGGLAAWQKKRVRDYIEEHLAEDIALVSLAALADLSRFHFARAFRQSFESPPHRYLAVRRIERAKELLRYSAQSVTAVGFEIGFKDTSSFSAAFRRHTGLTPTEFRRAADT